MDIQSRKNTRSNLKGSCSKINKEIHVAFISENLKGQFDSLNKSKFEGKQLHKFITGAIDDMKINPTCGTRIPKKLWPKLYSKRYEINNLWKYDLPNAWRLIYTIDSNEIRIMNIILEWFDHKEYDRMFKY